MTVLSSAATETEIPVTTSEMESVGTASPVSSCLYGGFTDCVWASRETDMDPGTSWRCPHEVKQAQNTTARTAPLCLTDTPQTPDDHGAYYTILALRRAGGIGGSVALG